MSRTRPSAQAFPRSRSYAMLALMCLAFIAYGSLAPFAFEPISSEAAQDAFGRVLNKPLEFRSRSDLVLNVLLLVPVGFGLMGALGVDRSRWLSLGDLAFVLPGCLAFSFAVEFAQVYTTNRVSSLEDIIAQFGGASLGCLVWMFVGQDITDWARWVWTPPTAVGLDTRLLPAYLLLLVLVHVVPLDLVTSPVEIYRKYKAGLINLVPFRYPADDPFGYAEGRMITGVYFVILGLMLPGLPWAFWRDRRQAGRVLGWSLLLACGLTGLKLLVMSRAFDVSDVILGALACLLGWWVSLTVREAVAKGGPWRLERNVLWGGLALWLGLVTFVSWQPFDFDAGRAMGRLRALPLVPFADVLRGDSLNAFASLVQKALMYLPLGILVTTWRPEPVRYAWVPALVCGGLVALALEAGQLFVGRTPALSDVYFAIGGAVLASLATRRVCEPAPPPTPFARLSGLKKQIARMGAVR